MLLRPPPELRVLDPKLPRKVDGPRFAVEDHSRRRYLELLIEMLPFLGHKELLSWCSGKRGLSEGLLHSRYKKCPHPRLSRNLSVFGSLLAL